MSPTEFAINVFIALFALIDPVGMVPLFAAATSGAPAAAQRRIALYVALFTLVFMSAFFLTGTGLLKFFGISMPAFRIAGGIDAAADGAEHGARRLHRQVRRGARSTAKVDALADHQPAPDTPGKHFEAADRALRHAAA